MALMAGEKTTRRQRPTAMKMVQANDLDSRSWSGEEEEVEEWRKRRWSGEEEDVDRALEGEGGQWQQAVSGVSRARIEFS